MIRRAALCIGLLGLFGCQSDESTSSRPSARKEDSGVSADVVGAPHSTLKSDLAIFRDRGQLHVGDTWDTAIELFHPPKGSFDFSDLPPRFQTPPYKVKGWDARREGFGVILYQGLIAAAMHQLPKSDLDQLNEIVSEHRRGLSPLVPKHVEGRRAQYWIWSADTQRLVIVGLQAQNSVKITVALGDTVVMDALGLSENDAVRDAKRVDDFFETQSASGKVNKPPVKDLR